jgi:hypothetical protein
LWNLSLSTPPTALPVIRKNVLYLGTAGALEARSLTDGAPCPGFHGEGGGVSGDLYVSKTQILFINAQGELAAVAPEGGRLVWKVPGARTGFAPLVARDQAIFLGQGNLFRISLSAPAAKPQPWMDISWLADGLPSAPLILHDSCLYAPLAGWGLVRMGKAR